MTIAQAEHELVELVDAFHIALHQHIGIHFQEIFAERCHRRGHVGEIIAHRMLLGDILHNHALVELRIPAADAHRTDEMLNVGVTHHHIRKAA